MVTTAEVITHRESGDPNNPDKSPGLTTFAPIFMERGVTHDTEFKEWANKVFQLGAPLGEEISLRNFRKDIAIELRIEAGQIVMAYHVFRCWVSEFQALPEMDASGDSVLIPYLKIENEGWERDKAVTEPVENSSYKPIGKSKAKSKN